MIDIDESKHKHLIEQVSIMYPGDDNIQSTLRVWIDLKQKHGQPVSLEGFVAMINWMDMANEARQVMSTTFAATGTLDLEKLANVNLSLYEHAVATAVALMIKDDNFIGAIDCLVSCINCTPKSAAVTIDYALYLLINEFEQVQLQEPGKGPPTKHNGDKMDAGSKKCAEDIATAFMECNRTLLTD